MWLTHDTCQNVHCAREQEEGGKKRLRWFNKLHFSRMGVMAKKTPSHLRSFESKAIKAITTIQAEEYFTVYKDICENKYPKSL